MKFVVIFLLAVGFIEPAAAQTVDTDHSSAEEHQKFCVKRRDACVQKNKWYRQHELTHCNTWFNQCVAEWKDGTK